jgi:hypothetical protein
MRVAASRDPAGSARPGAVVEGACLPPGDLVEAETEGIGGLARRVGVP